MAIYSKIAYVDLKKQLLRLESVAYHAGSAPNREEFWWSSDKMQSISQMHMWRKPPDKEVFELVGPERKAEVIGIDVMLFGNNIPKDWAGLVKHPVMRNHPALQPQIVPSASPEL